MGYDRFDASDCLTPRTDVVVALARVGIYWKKIGTPLPFGFASYDCALGWTIRRFAQSSNTIQPLAKLGPPR